MLMRYLNHGLSFIYNMEELYMLSQANCAIKPSGICEGVPLLSKYEPPRISPSGKGQSNFFLHCPRRFLQQYGI